MSLRGKERIFPNLLLPVYYFTPYLSPWGFLPVVPLMVLSLVLLVLVSLVTRPPSAQTISRFFDL